MQCDELITLADQVYCQAEGALIHIGELETSMASPYIDGVRIMFTDKSTGHKTIIEVDDTYLPELVIETEDFKPTDGHVYLVQATYSNVGGGIIPLRLKPFEISGSTISTYATAFDGFLVRFVRVFTATSTVVAASEQWLSLPE